MPRVVVAAIIVQVVDRQNSGCSAWIWRDNKTGCELRAVRSFTNGIDRSDAINVAFCKSIVGVVVDWNVRDFGKSSAIHAAVNIVTADSRAAVVRNRPGQLRFAIGRSVTANSRRAGFSRLGWI